MTFFFTGLIIWAYVLLLGDVSCGSVLLGTLAPVLFIMAVSIKLGARPGKTAKSMFGQIMMAGIFNSALLFILGDLGCFLLIPLHIFFLVGIPYKRLVGKRYVHG